MVALLKKGKKLKLRSIFVHLYYANTEVFERVDPSRSGDPIHSVVKEQQRTYCVFSFVQLIGGGIK